MPVASCGGILDLLGPGADDDVLASETNEPSDQVQWLVPRVTGFRSGARLPLLDKREPALAHSCQATLRVYRRDMAHTINI